MIAAETLLGDLAARCAALLPGRLCSVYLEGSGADGTRIATSDLDGTLIFHAALSREERGAIAGLIDERARATGIAFDLDLTDRAAVAKGVSPALKEIGRLVWGQEIRDEMPLVSLAAWTRDRLHTSYWRAATLFGRTAPLRHPLDAPDPADEFLGYCQRPVRLDGVTVPSTRDLIRHIGWAATGLIALRAGRYVARKGDCHRAYAVLIGDEWTGLLDDIYERCRGAWGYLVPEGAEDRAALRAICVRALAFENHFLAIYRSFLLDELRGADEAGRAQAMFVMGKAPLDDPEVVIALADKVGEST